MRYIEKKIRGDTTPELDEVFMVEITSVSVVGLGVTLSILCLSCRATETFTCTLCFTNPETFQGFQDILKDCVPLHRCLQIFREIEMMNGNENGGKDREFRTVMSQCHKIASRARRVLCGYGIVASRASRALRCA